LFERARNSDETRERPTAEGRSHGGGGSYGGDPEDPNRWEQDGKHVQIGSVEDQVRHAHRHLEEEGLSPQEITRVRQAIREDMRDNVDVNQIPLREDYPARNITVDGRNIQYRLHRYENDVVNIGRITVE
jgi:hypothetical protein